MSLTGPDLIAHYHCLAEQIGAVTISGLKCATCEPGEEQAQVILRPFKYLDVEWVKPDLPLVLISGSLCDRMNYVGGLHELGHIATAGIVGNTRFRRWPLLRQEAEAWRWAFKHMLIEPTPLEWRRLATCLRGYGERRHKKAPKSKPDPVYDALLADMERRAHNPSISTKLLLAPAPAMPESREIGQ